MGEPLLNYSNVLKSVERITSENGLGMSPKRITISTAGIHKKIIRLADDGVKFNLSKDTLDLSVNNTNTSKL